MATPSAAPPSATTPVLLAWSGGKDSALALHALRQDPAAEVVGLLTTVTSGYDRVSIHGVRRSLLHAQAAALGLPLHEATIPPDCSNEDYDAAMAEALARVRAAAPRVRTLAFGDIFLEDVRAYRESRLGALGWTLRFPLWGRDTAALAREFVALGFAARLACVDTARLAPAFAGRAYDAALLEALPPAVDPCGERGEFHTFVHAGPIFRAPVPCAAGEVVLRGAVAYCDLT